MLHQTREQLWSVYRKRPQGDFSGEVKEDPNPFLDPSMLATREEGDLALSALQPPDIGVTVQPYSPATVVDNLYVRTDNNYTSGEKSKLTNIQAGAQVNVQSDWNAADGDSFIQNKPNLASKMSVSVYDSDGDGAVDLADAATRITTYGSAYITSPAIAIIPLFTAPRTTLITQLRGVRLSAGTATLSIQVDGVSITGLSGLSITTTSQTINANALNIANVGNRVTVNITAATGANNLEFTLMAEVG